MKTYALFSTGLVACSAAALGAVVMVVGPLEPAPAMRQDATLMRPALKIDTSGGKVRVHGAMTVLIPVNSGRDHKVSVRLMIVRPEDEKVLYTEDLVKIDYHRAHPRKDYQINKELNFDAAGLDVKVAAVNAGDDVFPAGHEFASVVVHGVEPAPAPR